MTANTWLVAGLGNPGPGYASQRHNIGFMVVDQISADLGWKWTATKHSALSASGAIRPGGPKLVLLKPQTFMNESGRAVGLTAAFYGMSPEQLIVVHDELDLPFDTMRIKFGGGHAGHNGLRSIHQAIGTDEYVRVRVGIDRPTRGEVANYVLSDFSTDEKKVLPNVIVDAADAVLAIAEHGVIAAQQRFHSPAE